MQKEVKTEITKEKLIAAASKLIDGCDDPFKVTSRQIAEESGMQAAMINYCFGSRESLIYEVFHRKYKEVLDRQHFPFAQGKTQETPLSRREVPDRKPQTDKGYHKPGRFRARPVRGVLQLRLCKRAFQRHKDR